MPGAKRGKAYKFARAFHGPYRILEVVDNGVMVRSVDRPRAEAIRVALNRVRVCPKFLPDKSWPPSRTAKSKEQSSHVNKAAEGTAENFLIPQPHLGDYVHTQDEDTPKVKGTGRCNV